MSIGREDRMYWMKVMDQIARPVLSAFSERKIKQVMPIEGKMDDRDQYTYLEALGRLLTGMAPWLELSLESGEEAELQKEYRVMARKAIDAATDPDSPDFVNFNQGMQPVVDTAFLCHGILRAPRTLWEELEPRVQGNVIQALKSSRTIKPCFNNWLLFSAMVEATLFFMGEDWDKMRVDYALKQHEQWYLGDGVYGDGPEFHWDYYNSFVIHPMILDILAKVGDQFQEWKGLKEITESRAVRYAQIQERLISPEGTFPTIGRSLAYRFGAFQLLAQIALKEKLPEEIKPAQVRCGLTVVIKRMIEAPGTFDENGWLTIGFCGHQPDIGERYISTGSLYLCSAGLLPLGLSPDHDFWQGEEPWTAKKVWNGQNVACDHTL